jgi:hypothetical protein
MVGVFCRVNDWRTRKPMHIDTDTLILMFPIAFMFHDFEEVILGEPWLKKNAAEIKDQIKNRVPAFLARQLAAVLNKSASEFAFTVSLLFSLTVISSYLAVGQKKYGFFLLASGAFFIHGFGHIGQAVALRRYVPAVISSVLVVIPYGLALYPRLIREGIADLSGLLTYFLIGAALTVPFVLVIHKVGDVLYRKTVRLLID